MRLILKPLVEGAALSHALCVNEYFKIRTGVLTVLKAFASEKKLSTLLWSPNGIYVALES